VLGIHRPSSHLDFRELFSSSYVTTDASLTAIVETFVENPPSGRYRVKPCWAARRRGEAVELTMAPSGVAATNSHDGVEQLTLATALGQSRHKPMPRGALLKQRCC
jgi:hypothetical protein